MPTAISQRQFGQGLVTSPLQFPKFGKEGFILLHWKRACGAKEPWCAHWRRCMFREFPPARSRRLRKNCAGWRSPPCKSAGQLPNGRCLAGMAGTPTGRDCLSVCGCRYEKVREAGQVRDAAVLVASGITPEGERQVLGVSASLVNMKLTGKPS